MTDFCDFRRFAHPYSRLYIHLTVLGNGRNLEIEPEVRRWLDTLTERDYLTAEHAAERLLDCPTTLGEPYSRHLGDGLRQLRFMTGHEGIAIRLAYWLAPGQRIVLLTVFRKSRMREEAEIERARIAMKDCRSAMHTADDVFSRDVMKGKGR